ALYSMDLRKFMRFQLSTLETVLKEDIDYPGRDYFKDLYFVPNNLTQVSLDDVDLSITIFGKKLKYPVCVGSLVGGSEKLTEINQSIAKFSKTYELAEGIGDQIHGISPKAKKENIHSYSVIREENPDGLVFANLSSLWIKQSETFVDDCQKAVDMIKADVLQIYIDPLLDILMGYTEPGTIGLLDRLQKIISSITIPVIIKSRSTGLSNEDVRQLWDIGVRGFDIEGVGGTSFARLETLKHLTLSQKQSELPIKSTFDYFGTPTVWGMLDVSLHPENNEIPLIVGGGIRDGRQVIKALALGADLVSIAYPILIEITEDFGYPEEHNLNRWFENLIYQMKVTMCLLGVKNIKELRETVKSRLIITGKTHEWIIGRKLQFPPQKFKK
ncbi:MAG: alpha-hydroxy-acid oxidizing protein, partial [Promethearchaeota archaeon]